MKKLLLLLVSGSVVLSAGAQERKMGAVSASRPAKSYSKHQLPTTSNKTTATGSRWYNFAGDYVDTTQKIASGDAIGVSNATALLWQDTSLKYVYSTGSRNVTLVSMATIFDPHAYSFNDSTLFEGYMKLTTANAFTVDSVQIAGVYSFNPAKTSIVDTLVLSFVKGNAGTEATDDIFSGFGISGGHYGTVSFLDLHYDSVQNYARNGMAWGTAANNVMMIPLTSADWADTNVNGIWVRTVALPTALNVTAGGYTAMSISFRSGDATRPLTATPGDTLQRADGTSKYNNFQPLVSYVDDGTNVQFAPYIAGDHNLGYFKEQPTWEGGWSETYLPMFAYTSTSSVGAYYYQYPNVTWHVNCASCGVITFTPPNSVNNVYTISKVEAFPNPASSELNVPFTLAQAAHTTVTLTNMVGQVVATQDMGTVASGKAVFNTAALSAGVYFYSVNANGEHTTGRVAVAH